MRNHFSRHPNEKKSGMKNKVQSIYASARAPGIGAIQHFLLSWQSYKSWLHYWIEFTISKTISFRSSVFISRRNEECDEEKHKEKKKPLSFHKHALQFLHIEANNKSNSNWIWHRKPFNNFTMNLANGMKCLPAIIANIQVFLLIFSLRLSCVSVIECENRIVNCADDHEHDDDGHVCVFCVCSNIDCDTFLFQSVKLNSGNVEETSCRNQW